MKKHASKLSLIILFIAALWGFYDLSPSSVKSSQTIREFSIDNALVHIKEISLKPHYVGTKAHKTVQNYIVQELKELGLKPTIQTQTIVNKKWFAGTTVENIVVKINGLEKGKSLLLLSHYDSSPHSSLGASDAGSGVATILEGLRAYLAKNKTPKNDIIILISDAEELGLLGAKAFVQYHPWAKDIGLVLNFEARGSGGPSYMLLETNGKNSKLISEFINANPSYPTSNSLLYSIYKKLPNDTDLTVFREIGDINGFNFAFIDDHFDYHTAQDSYIRLDKTTLAHQADYLMNSLNYFSESDIKNLQSDKDLIYVNFPFIKILTYPFSWVMPLFIIAVILLLIEVFIGLLLNKIQLKNILTGFIPSSLSVILCGGISYILWKFILLIHPSYNDILQGFTYNGYWYIAAFMCLNSWICLFIYKKFTKQNSLANLLIAPLILWLIVNFLIQGDFKGAGFFIIPVFITEIILAATLFLNREHKNYSIFFGIISIPTIYIFAPLIKLFPAGLGLKALFVSAILLALVFGLLLPILNESKVRNMLIKLLGFLSIIFFGVATISCEFDINNRKPNSLVYVQNISDSSSYWGTYNTVLDSYISQKIDEKDRTLNIKNAETKSKYNTKFKYAVKAKNISIETSKIFRNIDTIINNNRILKFTITPTRKINKYELSLKDSLYFNHLVVNDIPVNEGGYFSIKTGTFLVFHMSNADKNLQIEFSIPKKMNPTILLNEISYDLLDNKLMELAPRSENMIPMPFVTNDAIISTQKIEF
tara:strand:- start:26743 stop:29040 length:2298 start_codon:yes stop_codon:yes gene_type:complete